RFLHNMVRRIVGAMLNISHLELDPKIILYWLEQKDAMQTIIYPAPPQGLYLQEVSYPKEKLDLNQ
ncbi:MAG: tRNA pseudouridine(38-40) synthase TruA, partial [Candidatus Cloacimonetes bacterium]|nr:tRNA pseudouridine(38-40) synthase TruA [Candidatus Cloacimonadota bacterium]